MDFSADVLLINNPAGVTQVSCAWTVDCGAMPIWLRGDAEGDATDVIVEGFRKSGRDVLIVERDISFEESDSLMCKLG